MRVLFLLCYALWGGILYAGDFSVFEEEGLYGVKDENGEVIIPAVHERLGWSDYDGGVFNGVIGYQKGNRWGLISVKNKVLTESDYHYLAPFDDSFILASVKAEMSNQLFYGLLEPDGDVEVSFNYSSLKLVGSNLLVSVLESGKTTKYGLLNYDNEPLIPLQYRFIEPVDQWLIADGFDLKKVVYDFDGTMLVSSADSVSLLGKGLVCYSSGQAGWINDKNKIKYDFVYKGFVAKGNAVTPLLFPKWEVYQGAEIVNALSCDSLENRDGIWITYLNGAQHLALEAENEELKNYDLMETTTNQLVLRHTDTKKWKVVDATGSTLFENYDFIQSSGDFYFARREKAWYLHNKYGSQVNDTYYEAIKEGVENLFITQRNGFWGLVDFQDQVLIHHKYDSIYRVPEGFYTVKFLGKWGLMNKYGNWIIRPNFNQLEVHGRLIIGMRGRLRSFFYDGSLFANSVYEVSHVVGEVPILTDSGKYGLINPINSVLFPPSYDTIEVKNDLVLFHKDGAIKLRNLEGSIEVDYEEGYQTFGEYSYGHVSVKKSGRWGFIDRQGRLRIAHRYDNVQSFEEGFAGVVLKGRWGFVDTKEHLVVQPFYEEVTPFRNGISIFRHETGMGLVNPFGDEVIAQMDDIQRLATGNYLVKNRQGLFGLVDASGNYILRPNFESLRDLDGEVLIDRNGRLGVLDYQGNQLVGMNYSDIRKTGDHIVARLLK